MCVIISQVGQGRTTSRVLSEPGGKSSVHLAWDSPKNSKAPTTAVVSKKEKEHLMKTIGSAAPSKSVTQKDQNQHIPSDAGGRGISSNAYATGSSQNVGNVITDRPTSRVTQPPGGHSSISFC